MSARPGRLSHPSNCQPPRLRSRYEQRELPEMKARPRSGVLIAEQHGEQPAESQTDHPADAAAETGEHGGAHVEPSARALPGPRPEDERQGAGAQARPDHGDAVRERHLRRLALKRLLTAMAKRVSIGAHGETMRAFHVVPRNRIYRRGLR